MREVEEGNRAAMLYLVNRGDCDRAGPADEIDPEYGETLRRAAARGVELLAYRAKVGIRGIRLTERVPFTL
jgi:sugar fermentation stimulation protein A